MTTAPLVAVPSSGQPLLCARRPELRRRDALRRGSRLRAWWGGFGGGWLPGGGHFVPQAAVEVEVVAPGLAGGGVAYVGVQRVAVVGELAGAAGAGDRGDLARQAASGRGGAGHRRPVRGAAAVAFRA